MAPGQRFVTPRGRACSVSDRGDSALLSNVRRYSPVEYWETLLTMGDRTTGTADHR
ncbi:hypothetical protein ACFV2Q_39050 [Streptomyces sp. NPDC059650]|uniref:hypothetical protein n=1 Tax=Streptomyces sp. NPDC059650 TaxID=3346896 RepID=UPI0036CBACE7